MVEGSSRDPGAKNWVGGSEKIDAKQVGQVGSGPRVLGSLDSGLAGLRLGYLVRGLDRNLVRRWRW